MKTKLTELYWETCEPFPYVNYDYNVLDYSKIKYQNLQNNCFLFFEFSNETNMVYSNYVLIKA